MIRLFYSGTYKVRHELINENNVLKLLKDDIRTKIVGDVKNVVYANDGVIISDNKNVIYVGGFYYEAQNNRLSVCENVVYEELKQIEKCDLLVANLTHYSAIATITEIMYAAFKNKKIIIFCDPNITSYDVKKEYWFSIITAKKLNKNVFVEYVKNEEEIIDYINNLKG